jgi:hypothetical protein
MLVLIFDIKIIITGSANEIVFNYANFVINNRIF